MDNNLIEMLVCPACKGRLKFKKEINELWCRADKIAFEIKDDIPVMLTTKARQLTLEELDSDN